MAGAGHVKGPTHAGPLSNIHPNGQSMQSPTPTGLSVNKPMPAIDKPMPAIDKPMPEIGKPMPELPSASASRQTMLSDVSSSSSGTSPSSMSAASATRQNPLVELIESEKVYVEHLGLVIRVSLLFCYGAGDRLADILFPTSPFPASCSGVVADKFSTGTIGQHVPTG
jgi:hypothetical protein